MCSRDIVRCRGSFFISKTTKTTRTTRTTGATGTTKTTKTTRTAGRSGVIEDKKKSVPSDGNARVHVFIDFIELRDYYFTSS